MNYLEIIAKLVAFADEVRSNMQAKGEEAARQFEEAVARNRKSFADMVKDFGGLPDVPPTPDPTDIYEKEQEEYPTAPPFRHGDHIWQRTESGKYFVTRATDPITGVYGVKYLGDL